MHTRRQPTPKHQGRQLQAFPEKVMLATKELGRAHRYLNEPRPLFPKNSICWVDTPKRRQTIRPIKQRMHEPACRPSDPDWVEPNRIELS